MPHSALEHRAIRWRVRTAIVLLIVLPLTATMMFMYSLWDPRPSLGHVPLALVHEDHGVKIDGQNKNYGE